MTVQLNSAVICCGPAEYGKTSIARKGALDHLTTYPTGIVLAHDRHRQLVKSGMTKLYDTVQQWRDERAKNPTAPRGASFRCAWSEVAKLAIELGEKHNTDDNVKLPIKLIGDETSLMNTSGPTHMDSLDFQIFADRRHWGIAIQLNVQRQSSLMVAFYDQATDVIIFSQGEEDARDLEKKLSLRKGELAPVVMAPPFHYLHWKRGQGIVNT